MEGVTDKHSGESKEEEVMGEEIGESEMDALADGSDIITVPKIQHTLYLEKGETLHCAIKQ